MLPRPEKRVGGPRKDTVGHGRGVFLGGVARGMARGGFTTKKRRSRRAGTVARVGWTTKYSKFTKGEAGARVLVVGGWWLVVGGWWLVVGVGVGGRLGEV
jgi:hypothetical protein